MNDVFKIFLSLSVSGSLLILFLLLCRRFWKDKMSRQWQYYIWLIVIARLLLPFTPDTNLMGKLFQTVECTIIQSDTGLVENGFGQNVQHEAQMESGLVRGDGRQVVQDILGLLVKHFWVVWLEIALVLLVRKVTIYQSFVRYVKAGRSMVMDVELLERLSVLAEQAGMKKTVELCVNPLISSPLLIGFFRPCIVLPGQDLSETEFRYTVLHELTHGRRRDMFYKWLVQVTVCLHWFNPLVYVMGHEIERACEFSCDEAVVAALDDGSARAYGKTLLSAMVNARYYKESLASVTLNDNKEMLKERLGAIMGFKKKSRFVTVFSTVLTAALLCMAAFTGAYAAVPGNAGDSETVVINLRNNEGQNSLIHSSSFQAGDGQVLTLEIESTIEGTVDLFLFSPTYQEQRITMDGGNDTRTIDLSEGTWAYNCTGFFDSGDISIVGTVK